MRLFLYDITKMIVVIFTYIPKKTRGERNFIIATLWLLTWVTMKCTRILGGLFTRSGQNVGALTQSHCTRMRTYIKLSLFDHQIDLQKVIKKMEVVVRLMVNRKMSEKSKKKYARTSEGIWKSNMQCVPFVVVVVLVVVVGHVPIIPSFILYTTTRKCISTPT